MEAHPIAELLQTEKKAEQLVERAKLDAQSKVEQAKKDADSILKTEEENAKKEAKELLDAAIASAKKEAQSIREEGQSKVVSLKDSSEKRMRKASTLILDSLDRAI